MQSSEVAAGTIPVPQPQGAGADRLYAEQIDHLYRLSHPGYLATLAVAAVAVAALWGAAPAFMLMLWLVAVAVVTAARYALCRAYEAAAPVTVPRRWARRFVAGAMVMGALWGVLGTLLYPPDDLPRQLFTVFAVGGVTIVSAVILAPLPRAFVAFMLPAALPVVARVLLEHSPVHWFMGLMMLAFVLLMARLSPLISGLVRAALAAKLENAGLIRELADSNDRLRDANRQLRARAADDRRNVDALRETSQKFEALIDAAPLAIVVRDADGRIERWNPAAERIFGWSEAELIGKAAPWYVSGLDGEATLYRARILRGDAFSNIEAVRRRKDGTTVTVSISGAPLHDAAGKAVGGLVIAADITARKRVERRLQMDHEISRVLAESRSAAEAIPAVLRTMAESTGWTYGARWNLDADGKTLRCVENWSDGTAKVDAFAAINQDRTQTLDGSSGLVHRVWESNAPEWIEDLLHETEMHRSKPALEAGLRCALAFPIRSGENFYGVMEFFGPGPSKPDQGLLEMVQTTGSQIGQFMARSAAEQDLKFLATHDALTGLPNRTLFGERLSHALVQARRYNRRLGLLFIDLDGFKEINDTLGHDAGDAFLREVAGRLRARLREGDIIGRLGGDEFVVLIEESGDRAQLAEVARALLDALGQPVALHGRACQATASIGITAFPQDGRDSQTLLKHADSAMYRAKERGKNRFHFYSL